MTDFAENLTQGKYKGIPFYTRSETLNGVGQNRVKHTYPKSSVQYQEPMGEAPFNATINMFFAGENYIDDYFQFQASCQDPSPGRLFMPSFGVFNNVIAEPFDVNAAQTSLGEISLSVTFTTTSQRPSPTETQTSEEDVSEQAQTARDDLMDTFEADYPTPSTPNNANVALSLTSNLSNAIKTATGLSRAVSEFQRKIDFYIQNATGYAKLLLNSDSPVGLLQSIAMSVSSGITEFKNIATIGTDQTNQMNDINDGVNPTPSTIIVDDYTGETDFTISLWDEDTSERTERNQIQLCNILTFRIAGLIGMLENAASDDYATTDEVSAVKATINEYYEGIMEGNSYDVIVPSMRESMDTLKGMTINVLESKAQQAYSVVEITVVRPISSWLLAYDLYGELIKTAAQHSYMADLITGLNQDQPPHRLKGTVKVVEIGN